MLFSDAVVALDVPVFFLLQNLVRGVLLVYLVRCHLRCVLQVGNRSNDAYSRAEVGVLEVALLRAEMAGREVLGLVNLAGLANVELMVELAMRGHFVH